MKDRAGLEAATRGTGRQYAATPHEIMAARPKGSVSPRRMSAGTPARAPQPQRALKYRYDAFMEEWTSEESVVMIARKPFADGGMRWCYKMYEIDQDGKHAPGVAKVFKVRERVKGLRTVTQQ